MNTETFLWALLHCWICNKKFNFFFFFAICCLFQVLFFLKSLCSNIRLGKKARNLEEFLPFILLYLFRLALIVQYSTRGWHLELSQILCRVSVLNDIDHILLTGKMFSVYPLNHMVYLAYHFEGHIQSWAHSYDEQYRVCHSVLTLYKRLFPQSQAQFKSLSWAAPSL